MSEEILDLSTVVERARVRIRTLKQPAGKLYELLNLDDLGPYELAVIKARHGEAVKLLNAEKKLTAPQKRALHKALGDIVAILIPSLEPGVLDEMEQAPRALIVQAWAARNAGGDQGNPAGGPTTAASSRASRRSTKATRKRGSTSRTGS